MILGGKLPGKVGRCRFFITLMKDSHLAVFFRYYGAISPRRERKAFETNKPPAMRVRVEGYTKKGIPLLQ